MKVFELLSELQKARAGADIRINEVGTIDDSVNGDAVSVDLTESEDMVIITFKIDEE